MDEAYISLCAPKHLVKTIKTRLEEHGKLSISKKITKFNSAQPIQHNLMIIPTNLNGSRFSTVLGDEEKQSILAALKLEDFADTILCIVEDWNDRLESLANQDGNPLIKAARLGLETLPLELLREISLTIDLLLSNLPMTYSLYPPLLLLPKHVFAGGEWEMLLSTAKQEHMQRFYQSIADALNVTHIATNAPIPRFDESNEGYSTNTRENILRSPTNLKGLYGDFGPIVTSSNPTAEDFDSAFWISSRQNGITQVWAPRYTMFSRGNVSEKARVLNLPRVKEAVEQGKADGRHCAAVDLYAGIGYFPFSYAKAGVDKVFCWEINPWSVEGFRRGAGKNKWEVRVVESDNADENILKDNTVTFIVFKMDNAKAAPIIERARSLVPPIRHVNCGLLPTSKGSWETALAVLDPELGGWIHLHENIATRAVEFKSDEIVEEIQNIMDSTTGAKGANRRRKVAALEHVEKVKTYAPGVMHCVLDIRISY